MKHLLALCLTFGLILCGCESQPASNDTAQTEGHDDHAHHDHDHHAHDDHDAPESFEAAVEQIVQLRDSVQEALANDDLKKADGPVHEVGHVLEALNDLAAKAGLSDEQQKSVKTAQEALFGGFAALDQTIHGKSDGKSWDDVKEEINQAISTLQELSSPEAREDVEDEA